MNSSFNQTGIDQARIQALVQIFTASGTTLSLTTTIGQKVIVWATGTCSVAGNPFNMITSLKYNGTTKQTCQFHGNYGVQNDTSFSLQYTDTPGAATANITVTSDAGSLSNVVITALVIG